MPTNSRRPASNAVPHNDNLTRRFNLPMLMGYLFLLLVFVGAVSSVYYWEGKRRNDPGYVNSAVGRVESGETSGLAGPRVIPTPNGQMCVIDTVTGQPVVPVPTPPNYNGECE